MVDYFFHLQFSGDSSVSCRTSISNKISVSDNVVVFLYLFSTFCACVTTYVVNLISWVVLVRFGQPPVSTFCVCFFCVASLYTPRLTFTMCTSFRETIYFYVYIFPLFKYTFCSTKENLKHFGDLIVLLWNVMSFSFALGESFHAVIFTFHHTSCLWMSHWDFIWQENLYFVFGKFTFCIIL